VSRLVRFRRVLRRAIGTPDASDVASAIDELRNANEDLVKWLERIEQRLLADADANARGADDTRQQLDQLRAAVFEQADTLDRIASDRIAGQTPGRHQR
jgi:hypothetical protein